MKLTTLIPVAFGLLLSAALPATASPILYGFTVTVNQVIFDRANVLPDAGIALGVTGEGTFSFDPDSTPHSSSTGSAVYANSSTSSLTMDLSIELGEFDLYGHDTGADVLIVSPNFWGFDWEEGGARQDGQIVSGIDYIFLRLFNDLGQNASYPGEPIKGFDPSIFNTGVLIVSNGGAFTNTAISFLATVSDIHAVPEPASLFLVVIGGLMATIYARRRTSAPSSL